MATSNANPIELSKARIAELQDEVSTRLKSFQRVSARRADIALGTMRDMSLDATYSTTQTALLVATNIVRLVPFSKPVQSVLKEKAQEAEQQRESLRVPAIANYDALNVKEVGDALDNLGPWELKKVKSYEAAHKNRKTVLGAVERLLA